MERNDKNFRYAGIAKIWPKTMNSIRILPKEFDKKLETLVISWTFLT